MSDVTDLELIKVEGSSFTGYVQDEYMTLSEREDRTLYTPPDIFWSYDDPEDVFGEDSGRYMPPGQARDITHVVSDEVSSSSVQGLIYQIGLCVLERYPQLTSVRFETGNRTWLSVCDDLGGDANTLREPPVPTGSQQFSMDRGDLDEQQDE